MRDVQSEVSASISVTHSSHFQRFGDPPDLDKAISVVQEAVQLTPNHQGNRPEMLSILANLASHSLSTRRQLRPLATVIMQKATIPSDHLSYPRLLGILGAASRQKLGEFLDLGAKSISMIQQYDLARMAILTRTNAQQPVYFNLNPHRFPPVLGSLAI
jgi:hypothetical protein